MTVIQQLLIDAHKPLYQHATLVALGNSYHKSLFKSRMELLNSPDPIKVGVGLDIIELILNELKESQP